MKLEVIMLSKVKHKYDILFQMQDLAGCVYVRERERETNIRGTLGEEGGLNRSEGM